MSPELELRVTEPVGTVVQVGRIVLTPAAGSADGVPTAVPGREREVAATTATLAAGSPALVVGAPGSGTTAVALAAAARLVNRFPGGLRFVPAATGLDPLLRALGVDPNRAADPTRLLWDALADHPTLLVLDDATSAEDLLPLLPRAGSALVATSAVPLPGLVGTVEPIRLVGRGTAEPGAVRAVVNALDPGARAVLVAAAAVTAAGSPVVTSAACRAFLPAGTDPGPALRLLRDRGLLSPRPGPDGLTCAVPTAVRAVVPQPALPLGPRTREPLTLPRLRITPTPLPPRRAPELGPPPPALAAGPAPAEPRPAPGLPAPPDSTRDTAAGPATPPADSPPATTAGLPAPPADTAHDTTATRPAPLTDDTHAPAGVGLPAPLADSTPTGVGFPAPLADGTPASAESTGRRADAVPGDPATTVLPATGDPAAIASTGLPAPLAGGAPGDTGPPAHHRTDARESTDPPGPPVTGAPAIGEVPLAFGTDGTPASATEVAAALAHARTRADSPAEAPDAVRAALVAVTLADGTTLGRSTLALADALAAEGRFDEARAAYDTALLIVGGAADGGMATAVESAATVTAMDRVGRDVAGGLPGSWRDDALQAAVLHGRGLLAAHLDRPGRALADLRAAVALHHTAGDVGAAAITWQEIAEVELATGARGPTITAHRTALALFAEAGDRLARTWASLSRATVQVGAGAGRSLARLPDSPAVRSVRVLAELDPTSPDTALVAAFLT